MVSFSFSYDIRCPGIEKFPRKQWDIWFCNIQTTCGFLVALLTLHKTPALAPPSERKPLEQRFQIRGNTLTGAMQESASESSHAGSDYSRIPVASSREMILLLLRAFASIMLLEKPTDNESDDYKLFYARVCGDVPIGVAARKAIWIALECLDMSDGWAVVPELRREVANAVFLFWRMLKMQDDLFPICHCETMTARVDLLQKEYGQ